MRYRSNNGNSNRLLKQVSESDFEYREYGAPKIRPGSCWEPLYHMGFYDTPLRSDWNNRSWKKHRKFQHK